MNHFYPEAPLLLAAIVTYVAVYHFLLFSHRPRERKHLAFSLLCLAIVFYDTLCSGLYLSESPAEGVVWQRWQFVALCAVSISALWFVTNFIGKQLRWLDSIFIAYFTIQAGIQLCDRSKLTWTDIPSVKPVQIAGNLVATYNEMTPGILSNLQSIVGMLLLAYILYRLVRQYQAAKDDGGIGALVLGMIFFGVGVVNDTLVSQGVYCFFYLIEYCYLLFALCMAYALTREQVFLQNELALSEEKYRSLVDNVPDIIYQLDSSGRIASLNEAGLKLLGYDKDDIIGRHFSDIIYPADVEMVTRVFRAASTSRAQKPASLRLRISAREGGPVWVSLNGRMNYDAAGRFLGEQGVIRNINERMRAEDDLSKLAAAVNQADESIIVTDVNGNIEYVNPCFEKMTGYSKAEIIGKNTSFLKSGKHTREFYDELWATLKAGKTWRGTFTNRRKDGSLFQESAVISPVTNNDGKILNYVAVKRDITQELALENQLRESQKMEAIGRFAGGIAHDFTNALVIMLNSAQMIKKKIPQEDTPCQELADAIIKAADKTSALTSQLLAFSQSHQISPRVINLNKVVAGVEVMLQRILGSATTLTICTSPNPIFVKADPSQIEQIIIHMAVNAHEAMPDGGHLTIETDRLNLTKFEAAQLEANLSETERIWGHVGMIAISDTGCGMTKDIQSHIFEPFFTTKGRGRSTGLGLSTSYAIARKHGGYTDVFSSPGRGTTFRVYLPVADATLATAKPQVQKAGNKNRILVVDDDLLSRHMLVTILKNLHYSVLEIDNGRQALDILRARRERVDLVITDLVMPQIDGEQFVSEARKTCPDCRILMTSAYPKIHLVKSGILSEDDLLLPKPFTIESVSRIIAAALAKSVTPTR